MIATIRSETIAALIKQDSIPKFGELAAQDLAAIWELGHDGNRNHKRTWLASRRALRKALETKCDSYFPGWRSGIERPGAIWLKAERFCNQVMKDITDMAALEVNSQ